jgi:HSP20 family molecular chaperone IbpA
VRAFSPPVDIFESPEAVLLHVDVPGVAKEDVTLRLEKNELSIVATRRESLHGPIEYRRAFTLPQDVDGDAIVADLTKGVLALTLPRKASAKPRTIQIRG